jgi:hypothetical protein
VSLEDVAEDQGRYMTGFDRVCDGFFDERPRRSDLTELPLGDGEEGLRDRAGIQPEADRDRKCSAPQLNSLAPR